MIKLTPARARLALIGVTICALGICAFTATAQKRKPASHPKVCGNPNLTCTSDLQFEPYALPFRFPANGVIYDTELFYAIILRSVPSCR
jgi:hypothetical protein